MVALDSPHGGPGSPPWWSWIYLEPLMVAQDPLMVSLEPSGSSPGGPASPHGDSRSPHGGPRALCRGVVGVRGCRWDRGPESLSAA